ncbi:MAG: alanine:cation symporter family protein [Spirochaetaceae bacterium]|nr:alanine:cation symporter family protein [Spirochaetaceae bacterium]
MQILNSIISSVSNFLYSPWVPLFLVLGGFYLSFRTRFVQFRLLGESIRVVTDKPKDRNSISSFGALMVSTASRVGTGNIIGVSTSICLGGVGSIFWMWAIALIGGASAFVESTLAQIYKRRNPDGTSYGGPSYYMEAALGRRWLGVIFSVIILLTYAVGYNALASFNLQSTFAGFSFYHAETTPFIIGIILTVLFALSIMGGARHLVRVSSLLVPLMGIIYIGVSLVVVFMNISRFPQMISNIFADAFNFKAIFGGFAGSCLMYGIKRGLYSNEAGMGSAPNAAATAEVSHPVKQGLVQMLSVFIDTLLVCTATAFMCMMSDVVPTAEIAGAAYVQQSLGSTLGGFGPVFIAISMCLFAFTTLIGNYSYCEGCLKYLLKKSPSKAFLIGFRIVASLLVLVGAIVQMDLVWNLADLLQGTMVIIHIPVIVLLAGTVVKALKDYTDQKKEGKEPEFKAQSIGITTELDFWS